MGGPRRESLEALFAEPAMAANFEPPIFSPGVPSRSLRSRYQFLSQAYRAGLLPEAEWEAVRDHDCAPDEGDTSTDAFFAGLGDVPVTTGRRGSAADIRLHYSRELWQKAKGINRGRAVLGCTFAHLIALRVLVDQELDFVLEDNVRVPLTSCADRIWELLEATSNRKCHHRYYGWLGSVPNLRWIYDSHAPRFSHASDIFEHFAAFPFPSNEDIGSDLTAKEANSQSEINERDSESDHRQLDERKPGGNPVWGCYAYWISKEAFAELMETLRNDVGAMLWKTKRARHYIVKPIDKILPRLVMRTYGQEAVLLPSHPAFFRAPMLTSKIHTKWDAEFCKSTKFQLEHSGLSWSDLWLTAMEKAVVAYHEQEGEWLTPAQLTNV